ncbi:MAG: hypothetical protein MUC96_22845 [Myxococcaceae bacterium]|nr:hypothetical protein [Myxococcaceae bacterium]
MVLTAVVAVSLMAAPETWVVVSRRTGTTGPKSLEVAGAVAKALTSAGVPSTLTPEDLSSCGAKKACLVEKGKAKGVPAMVLVDVGVVLGEGVAKLEAISVDEFGKKIAVADAEAKADAIGGALVAKVPTLVGPLKEVLGIKDAPAAVTKVEPPKEEPKKGPPPAEKVASADPLPPPPPPPALDVSSSAAPSEGGFFTTSRVIGLSAAGVGVGVAVVGAVFLSQAAAASRTIDQLCPVRTGCPNAEAVATWERGRTAQNTGVALLVGGGLAAVSGLVLFLLNPGAPAEPAPAVSFFVAPGGGGASLSLVLP